MVFLIEVSFEGKLAGSKGVCNSIQSYPAGRELMTIEWGKKGFCAMCSLSFVYIQCYNVYTEGLMEDQL